MQFKLRSTTYQFTIHDSPNITDVHKRSDKPNLKFWYVLTDYLTIQVTSKQDME